MTLKARAAETLKMSKLWNICQSPKHYKVNKTATTLCWSECFAFSPWALNPDIKMKRALRAVLFLPGVTLQRNGVPAIIAIRAHYWSVKPVAAPFSHLQRCFTSWNSSRPQKVTGTCHIQLHLPDLIVLFLNLEMNRSEWVFIISWESKWVWVDKARKRRRIKNTGRETFFCNVAQCRDGCITSMGEALLPLSLFCFTFRLSLTVFDVHSSI